VQNLKFVALPVPEILILTKTDVKR